MLVLGLGGAAVAITNGDFSLTISGMSLAAVVGIILNSFLSSDDDNVATLIDDDKAVRRLKNDIKSELTVELKEDILKAIKEEMNKNNNNNNNNNNRNNIYHKERKWNQ